MSLQVCEYPTCKKLTLMTLCEEHRDEEFEEDNEDEREPPTSPTRTVQPKEATMKGQRCTKNQCHEDAAEDSVRCPKHRDQQRASNERFQGRALQDAEKPTRKYTERTMDRVPAPISRAPITLADPALVTSHRRIDLTGNAITALDRFIGKLESDLATVREARAIMQQEAIHDPRPL